MNSPTELRLMIVDDHFVVRMGLRTSLEMEPDFRVVAEADSGEQALAQFREVQPDIVLLDLRLPGGDGIVTTERLCAEFSDAKIVVISTFKGDEDIFRALQAGAKGYLPKSIQREELVTAIRTVAGGESYLPASIATQIAGRMRRSPLSERELQVLRLVSDGTTNKEIAVALGLAEVTVKLHVGNILMKLGAKDRTEATRIAIQRGMVWIE